MSHQPVNPVAVQAAPLQGQPLPRDWQLQAKQRAATAQENYQRRLETAWQRGFEGPATSAAQAARLTNQQPSWTDVLGQK